MRKLVVAGLMAALAGCASLPSRATGVEIVRVNPATRPSQQEQLSAYWRERERQGEFPRDASFVPRTTQSGYPTGFPDSRDSAEQAWRETIRLERESAERRQELRDAIQQ